jgi:hypothetical protein
MNTTNGNFKNVKVGQTLNIVIKGIQTTAIVYHVSRCQIDVRFWDLQNPQWEALRSFTTKGVVRYLSENSFIQSVSL